MNKQELLAEVQNQLSVAKEFKDQVTARYTLSYEAYRGEVPAKTVPTDISATRVMWEAFESIYPSLIAIFTDNQKSPVSFDSDTMTNGKLAAAITKAIHGTALKVNGALKMYMLAIKEILITGNQVAQVGYDVKKYETEKYTLDNVPLADLVVRSQILMKAGYNINQDITVDEDAQTVSGTIQGKREIKFPVINLIDFADFYICPTATDVESSPYTAYRENITIAKALEAGYPESKLLSGQKSYTNDSVGLSKQLIVINDMNSDIDAPDTSYSEYNRVITIHHHYWRGCYKGKEEKLYHVVATETDILACDQVEYCGLVLGGMSIVPGSVWSESLYDMCINAQINKTRAMRAIQRSADGAAYGEYEYIRQQMEKDGLETFVNSRGPGAAYAVKMQNTVIKLGGTDVPNAMQLLNNEINEAAQATIQGSAGQAGALEENSQASGTAIALTQDKQELNENQIASTIAETFIKPIYKILLLVLQEIGTPLEFEGTQIPFKLIRSDLGLSVSIKSAYDRAKAAANVKQAYEQAATAGTLPKNIQPENVYNIYADYFRAATGQEDVSRYITAPDQMPQPSPLEKAITAFITVSKLRGEIAATQLAEAKVEDQRADAQKKYNDALYDLAKIKEIFENLNIKKVETLIQAKELEEKASNDVTQNAQEQERIDQTNQTTQTQEA